MSNTEDFDFALSERFRREHPQVPEEPFVDATMRAVRSQRRWMSGLRTARNAAVLGVVAIASPWLISGATRLNVALESSLSAMNNLGPWAMVLLGALVLLALRVRSR